MCWSFLDQQRPTWFSTALSSWSSKFPDYHERVKSHKSKALPSISIYRGWQPFYQPYSLHKWTVLPHYFQDQLVICKMQKVVLQTEKDVHGCILSKFTLCWGGNIPCSAESQRVRKASPLYVKAEWQIDAINKPIWVIIWPYRSLRGGFCVCRIKWNWVDVGHKVLSSSLSRTKKRRERGAGLLGWFIFILGEYLEKEA